MKKRVIAITQRLATQESYQERREMLACNWGSFFAGLEILPIPLSYAISLSHYCSLIDGVVLSGGNDLSVFGDDENSICRDEYESEVIEHCIANQIPLLGVCRGAQMIAHYFASTLKRVEGHVGWHKILWNDGMSEEVNSYHRYKISFLGDYLLPEAVSMDGGIEAFSHESLPIFGIMWHPEREEVRSESTRRMLEKFLKERR